MSTNLKQILGIATIILIAALLLLAGFLVGRMYIPGMAPYSPAPGMMTGRGMPMNGYGDYQGGYGRYSMMNGGMMSGNMMGNYANPALTNAEPLSLEEAEDLINDYIDGFSAEALAIREIMIFDNHAYAQLVEQSTGIGAMEVLVDPVTGVVYPEHGPNMMWNIKYGMMGGNAAYLNTAELSVTEDQAVTFAQRYLDTALPGTVAGEHADAFYGYYTLHVEDTDGHVIGMLSVNGYDGQVFLHTWHGAFIEMSEME